MNFLYLTQEGKAGSEAQVVCLTQPATWCQPWVVEVAQRLGAQGGGQGRALGKGGWGRGRDAQEVEEMGRRHPG